MLVDALSERWGVERNGGTTVWFEVPLALFGPSATV